MTHSGYQTASLYSHLSWTNWLVNKVAMVTGMEVMRGLGDIDFHALSLIWLQPLLSAQCVTDGYQQRALDSTPFLGEEWGISQSPGGRLIRVGCCQMLSLNIDLPAYNASAKPLYMHVQNALFSLMVFNIVFLLTTELILHPMKYSNEFMLMDFSWSYHVFHHSEAADLLKLWNGLLKIWSWYQLCGNTLKNWGNVLQDEACALNQWWRYGALFLTVRIHGLSNQGVEMGVGSLTISTSVPVFSSCLKSIVFEEEIHPPQQWFH